MLREGSSASLTQFPSRVTRCVGRCEDDIPARASLVLGAVPGLEVGDYSSLTDHIRRARDSTVFPELSRRMKLGYKLLFRCSEQRGSGFRVTSEKQPNPIDWYIGRQLRLARKLRRLSQKDMAERLYTSFQQIQKYEKGVNRISASRLHNAALILNLPIPFFFPTSNPPSHPLAQGDSSSWETVIDFSASPEAADLAISFSQIRNSTIRRRLVALVRALAD